MVCQANTRQWGIFFVYSVDSLVFKVCRSSYGYNGYLWDKTIDADTTADYWPQWMRKFKDY